MWKHEHEMKQTNLWCKIMLQTTIEQIEGNWVFILSIFGDLSQGGFHGGFHESFHMPNIFQKAFLKTFLNYKLTIN
jgi:hypothetical protein